MKVGLGKDWCRLLECLLEYSGTLPPCKGTFLCAVILGYPNPVPCILIQSPPFHPVHNCCAPFYQSGGQSVSLTVLAFSQHAGVTSVVFAHALKTSLCVYALAPVFLVRLC